MKPQILIVEDEPELLEIVVAALRQQGFDAIPAASGEAAWNHADCREPDLIILDVLLPDLDGLSLCEMFRRNPLTARTPILMLTACATLQMREIAQEAGANAFMTKPFALADLAAKARELTGA